MKAVQQAVTQTTESVDRNRQIPLLKVVLLLVCVLLAYSTVLQSGGWIWDDDDYVLDNAALRGVAGLRDIWLEPRATPQYYPLVFTSFWLEYQLFELRPFGYHLTNVLLHILSALLFWAILRRLRHPIPWWTAVLFGVHPLCVESVGWVTERKNVLSLLCALLATRALLVAVASGRKGPWTAATLWFVAGLLSKTVIASLPAVWALLLFLQRRLQPRLALHLTVLLLIGAAFGVHTAWLEVQQVGAGGVEFQHSLAERLLIAGRVPWFYASKLSWPQPLLFTYPRWQIDAGELWQWSWPLLTLVTLALLWAYRHSIGRAPMVAVLIFGGTLFPVLGFVNVYPMRYSYVADHFCYHAAPALLALLTAVGWRLLRWRWLRVAAGAGLLLVAIALCRHHGRQYASKEALWTTLLAGNPQAFMAHHNLGVLRQSQAVAARREGRAEDSRRLFREAMQHMESGLAVNREPKLLFSIGQLALEMGLQAGGDRQLLQKAEDSLLEVLSHDPNNHWADLSLGHLYAAPGFQNLDRVIEHIEKAMGGSPLRQGDQRRYEEAMAPARPKLLAAYVERGTRRARSGSGEAAVEDFRRAMRIPGSQEAQRLLAWIRASHSQESLRKPHRALSLAENLQQLAPAPDPQILDLLAAAYAATERYEEAGQVAARARQLAQQSGQLELADRIQSREAHYRQRQPYRSTTGLPQ